MTAKKEEYSIVCATDTWGFNEENFIIIRDKFVESQPDYWEFLSPNTLIAYFLLVNDGRERASKLSIQLEGLKKDSSLFTETGLGHSEGLLIVNYDKSGKIDRAPIGMASSNAMLLAGKNNK